jgi:hypothetical protein
MKTKLTGKAKRLASALLTALVIVTILSLFVMYYLSLIEQQSLLSARSQVWDMAISVAEAGVEDGLQQLNNAYPDMNTDGWTYDGSTCYWKSNTLPDGNRYDSFIYITNAPNPVIISRGYLTAPSAIPLTGTLMFAQVGVNPTPSTITRSVQVTCSKKTPWTAAMIAKKNINLNGNNISTDSFDSSNPLESVNGQYSPSYYRGSHGDIATDLGVIDSIGAGNAKIYGHAHTGPGSPSNALQIGPNGYVGPYPQSGTGVQAGWWLPDANFTFPDITYPNTALFLTATGGVLVTSSQLTNTVTVTQPTYPSPAPPGVVTNTTFVNGITVNPATSLAPGTYYGVTRYDLKGVDYFEYYLITGYSYPSNYTTTVIATNTYDAILWGTSSLSWTNYYVANSLSGQTIVMGDNVVLVLPNGLTMSAGDTFTVAPAANVTVYSGGTSNAIGGNGVVNQAGYAANFLLFCAPSVTTFALNGNGTFIGVIVAPKVDVSLNGGGATPTDFVGALMANSVTLNGHFNLHYDEALGGNKSMGRFLITSWNEVKF